MGAAISVSVSYFVRVESYRLCCCIHTPDRFLDCGQLEITAGVPTAEGVVPTQLWPDRPIDKYIKNVQSKKTMPPKNSAFCVK